MDFTFSGGTPQQVEWAKEAIVASNYPNDQISAKVTVTWAPSTPCGTAHTYMCTTQNSDGSFVITIEDWADDPNNQQLSGLANPPADVKTFYMQSLVHELGHVIHYTLVNTDALRSQMAALFWKVDINAGSGKRYGTFLDYSHDQNPNLPWGDCIVEAIAECVKCAFYTQRLVFMNRTNWRIDESNWGAFLRLIGPLSATAAFHEDWSGAPSSYGSKYFGWAGPPSSGPGLYVGNIAFSSYPLSANGPIGTFPCLFTDPGGGIWPLFNAIEMEEESVSEEGSLMSIEIRAASIPDVGSDAPSVGILPGDPPGATVLAGPQVALFGTDPAGSVFYGQARAGFYYDSTRGAVIYLQVEPEFGTFDYVIIPVPKPGGASWPLFLAMRSAKGRISAEIWQQDPFSAPASALLASVAGSRSEPLQPTYSQLLVSASVSDMNIWLGDWKYGSANVAIPANAPYPFALSQGTMVAGPGSSGILRMR